LCIILDIQENEYALKEALKLRIPVMAFVNTNDDIRGVSFPIFGANKSLLWVRWVFEVLLRWDEKNKSKK
jgi:ribosomal protein S2